MKEDNPLFDICGLFEELVSSYDLTATLDMLAKNITELIGAKGCTIRLLDEKNKTLQIVAAYGMSRSYLEKGPVILEKHHIDQRVLAGECIRTKDITAEPHVLYLEEAKREGIRSVMICPLTVREKAIGILRVYTSIPYFFYASEIDFLFALASDSAIAIENARLFEHIESEYEELARDVWKWYDWGSRFPRI